jgi:hypothetical protein
VRSLFGWPRLRGWREGIKCPLARHFHTLIFLAVNVGLPLLIYHQLARQRGEGTALLLSSVPPLAWSGWDLARFRRVDAISLLVLLGIFLSLGAIAVGGSPRLLLLRESLVTGLIGLGFLASMLRAKPLMFYLARSTVAKESAEALQAFEAAWSKRRLVRFMRLTTLAWGSGLVAEALLRCWLAWAWPIERFLAIVPVISYGTYFGLMGWTMWYARRLRATPAGQAESAAKV